MRFLSWLRHLTLDNGHGRAGQGRRHRPRRKPASARLHLEPLEDRCCPSASYSVTDLGTLGGLGSYAYGINKTGQVVGEASNGSAVDAFLWTPGSPPQMNDLGTLGGTSPFPPGNPPSSQGNGINNAGQVVGEAFTASGHYHAFLWTPGGTGGPTSNPQMLDLGTLGGGNSIAYGINNATPSHKVQVVGVSDTAGGQQDAFLWTQDGTDGVLGNAQMKDLGSFTPRGINDIGQVTGDDVLWQNGTLTPIGSLGGGGTIARAINAGGQVAGQSHDQTGNFPHAFRWSPTSPNGTTGQMADLGVLKLGVTDKASAAYGIDTAGDVVGWSGQDLVVMSHAAYWAHNGSIKDLNSLIPANPPGFSYLENATGINDGGQIVGWGYSTASSRTTGEIDHAFLLTPISGKAAVPIDPGRRPGDGGPVHHRHLDGVDTSGLGSMPMPIRNQDGGTLGLADATPASLWLDAIAAGSGGLVDNTPSDVAAFPTPGDHGEQHPTDLLTVLQHELDDVLGYKHTDSGVLTDT
jgi:probable HAF family extracellular repeat protein